MKYLLLTLFIIVPLQESLFAQTSTVRGTVTDLQGEPLTGATIVFSDADFYGVAGLDGSFIIRNVPAGEYEVEVSFISYSKLQEVINISDEETRISFRMEPVTQEMGEVSVMARRDLRTEESARVMERQSVSTVNVVDARTIDLSPDVTVANVAQRVSGVSIERSNSGDGQHAIVRGMDKRYNYTLVNGIKIPSPEATNRYVPLDIFPSDLLDRLVVSKTLTPDMEGDAIGGVIDMKMRDAPDRLTVNANIGTGYSQIFRDRDYLGFNQDVVSTQSPRVQNGEDYRAELGDFPFENLDFQEQTAPLNQIYGLAVGNRFLDGRLGVLLAGSYQKNYRGANSLFYEMDTDREDNNPFFDTVQQREFSTEQTRAGLHSKLDFQWHEDHKIDIYNAFIQLDDALTRARVDTNLRIGRSQGPGTGRITHRFLSQQKNQSIFNTTVQGDHNFLNGNLNANWSAVYSRAAQDDPDRAEFKVDTGARLDGDGNIVQERALVNRDLDRRWSRNSDEDRAGYANLTYLLDFQTVAMEFSAGAMARFKSRSNDFNSYLLRLSPNTQEWDGDILSKNWVVTTTTGTPTDPLNYRSEENVVGYYGMLKSTIGSFEAVGGVRVETTDFSWNTNAPERTEGRIGAINYTDVLPSIHLKYSPLEDVNTRLSYFQSISRPNFLEVIPYRIIEDEYQERGNPNLQRTQAQNVDLRFEYYPNRLDQIMAAFFFKEIRNPIETALAIDGQRIYRQPNNFGTAYNSGFEFDVTKYIRNFGLRAFYTFTNSEISTSKIVRFRDDNGNLTSREQQQTRPLQGQSKHISNVSLLYKNQQWGTDMQLSGVYTGRRIISVSPYFENDIWQRSFWQVDLSVEQQLMQGVKMYAKVNNILNTPMQADVLRPNTANPGEAPNLDVSENTLVQQDFYQQTWLIGIKYNL